VWTTKENVTVHRRLLQAHFAVPFNAFCCTVMSFDAYKRNAKVSVLPLQFVSLVEIMASGCGGVC